MASTPTLERPETTPSPPERPSTSWGITVVLIAVVLSVVAALLVSAVAGGGEGEETAAPSADSADEPAAEPRTATSVSHDPTDLPAPVGARAAQTVSVELEAVELEGQLADGTTYNYWTFNGTVPGPMIRVREGDTVELTLANADDSTQIHSIDLHAVNGPGGGAAVTQVPPGESKSFTFTPLRSGVYVYHCASPHVPSHIANGMYGMIIVEPEGGLEPVDREFYVMQGDMYTVEEFGTPGLVTYDSDAMTAENPNYVVFNGAVNALTGDNAMPADVGDTVRLFVGNGGPNAVSSFHVIGEIFDRAHVEGGTIVNENVQTTLIPAGGATWVEFTIDVPGDYLLVDHSITRVFDKGALAIIHAEGDANPAVFEAPEG